MTEHLKKFREILEGLHYEKNVPVLYTGKWKDHEKRLDVYKAVAWYIPSSLGFLEENKKITVGHITPEYFHSGYRKTVERSLGKEEKDDMENILKTIPLEGKKRIFSIIHRGSNITEAQHHVIVSSESGEIYHIIKMGDSLLHGILRVMDRKEENIPDPEDLIARGSTGYALRIGPGGVMINIFGGDKKATETYKSILQGLAREITKDLSDIKGIYVEHLHPERLTVGVYAPVDVDPATLKERLEKLGERAIKRLRGDHD